MSPRRTVIGLALGAMALTAAPAAFAQASPASSGKPDVASPEVKTPIVKTPEVKTTEVKTPEVVPDVMDGVVDTTLPPDEELMVLPPNSSATAAPPKATKLSLRGESKPLELSPEPADDGLWWKVIAGTVLLGAAAFAAKKRGLLPKSAKTALELEEAPTLSVITRVALAGKGELVVASVDGQQFLLGVTTSRITRLACLNGDEPRAATASKPRDQAAPPPATELDFDRLLEAVAAADGVRARSASTPTEARDPKKATPPPTEHRPVERSSDVPAPISSRPRVRINHHDDAEVSLAGGTQALSLKALRQRKAS